MKVAIGFRRWLGPEWTHVDIDPTPLIGPKGEPHPVDVVSDARSIDLPDQCAELVYTQECLEHFPYRATGEVLSEWCRLVAPGGKIRVEVPDFLAACQQVLAADNLEMDRAIQQIIFGGQANEFDFHYAGVTPRILSAEMEANGLEVVDVKRGWEHGWLMVEARRG